MIAAVTLAGLVWRSRRSLLLGVTLGLAFHFLRDISEPNPGVALLWPWDYHAYMSPHWIFLAVVGVLAVMALAVHP